MSIQVFLDDQDITDSLNSQHALPSAKDKGVFPDRSRAKWWDLLPAISANETLKKDFFNDDNGVHVLRIAEDGAEIKVKLLLRTKYSARNR